MRWLVRFLCGSSLPECWRGHLLPGRSHTCRGGKWSFPEMATLVLPNVKLLNAPYTHTKRKRVHTWSEVGHTHMFPCFWRSFEVITVRVEVSKVSIWMFTPLLCILSQTYLRRERCSSGCCYSGTYQDAAAAAEKTVKRKKKCREGKKRHGECREFITEPPWGTCFCWFIDLQFLRSSSLVGIRWLPLPISAHRGRRTVTAGLSIDRDAANVCNTRVSERYTGNRTQVDAFSICSSMKLK